MNEYETIGSPARIMALMLAYAYRDPWQGPTTFADELVEDGLLCQVKAVWKYETTPRGDFLVEHLIRIPLPVDSFYIPRPLS